MRNGAPPAIRRLAPGDAEGAAAVIRTALRETNAEDYPAEFLEAFAQRMTADEIRRRAETSHFYAAFDGGRVVGCGAAAPYEGRADECELRTVFVLPEYQGAGLGRRLVEALENDELCRAARRIELSSSITAVGFYRKLGYRFKGGEAVLNETLGYPMEKFR